MAVAVRSSLIHLPASQPAHLHSSSARETFQSSPTRLDWTRESSRDAVGHYLGTCNQTWMKPQRAFLPSLNPQHFFFLMQCSYVLATQACREGIILKINQTSNTPIHTIRIKPQKEGGGKMGKKYQEIPNPCSEPFVLLVDATLITRQDKTRPPPCLLTPWLGLEWDFLCVSPPPLLYSN